MNFTFDSGFVFLFLSIPLNSDFKTLPHIEAIDDDRNDNNNNKTSCGTDKQEQQKQQKEFEAENGKI